MLQEACRSRLEVEPGRAVFLGLVVDDVVGDQGCVPGRPLLVTCKHVRREVGISGGHGHGRAPQLAPGASAEIGQGRPPDRRPAGYVGHVEPGRQGGEDLGIAGGLGLLEDPLQGPPRAIRQGNRGDGLQQDRSRERAGVAPEGINDLVEPEPIGQRDLGAGRFERLELLLAIMLLFLARLLAKRRAANLGKEPVEGQRPITNRSLVLVILVREVVDELDQSGILRLPGAADVVQSESGRHGGSPRSGPGSNRSGGRLRRSRPYPVTIGGEMGERLGGGPTGESPCGPPPTVSLSGRLIYHKTWDIEGSLARPPTSGTLFGGTPIGGVAPGPAEQCPRRRGISEPETAFVVMHDQPNARAAQRRPWCRAPS